MEHALKLPDFTGKVAVIGDVMLDRYWHGPSSRLSPEAPVPVVRVCRREDRAGGAANVAINVAAVGAPCTLVGLVGADEAAVKLEKIVRDRRILPHFIISGNHPTITKLRVLSRNQQLLRLDFEEPFADLDAPDILKSCGAATADCPVIIASDYGKGTLARVAEMIAAARARGAKILIDPKGTDFSRYRGATLLTPNMAEFAAVAGTAADEADLERRARRMLDDLNLTALLITRSENGMSLFCRDRAALHLPTRAREVYDVTGAGDTVIAVAGAALAAGAALPEACELANRAAGIVVGKLGTSTVSVDELRRDLHGDAAALSGGVITEPELLAEVARLRSAGKRVVMTNGCFDLLHRGHVQYLQRARQLGDRLIVAVNTDRSVRALKGAGRPLNPLAARMEVLAALNCVDYVVAFDEDTPERLISLVLPDVLVKGGDYRVEDIAGHARVQRHGGQVTVLPYLEGCSTTALIDKIRA